MTNTLVFELASPEKLVVSRKAAMVTIPGEQGDYSVLAGHAPLITSVRPGVVDIYDDADGQPVERLFIAGGFAETTNERCTVLAEQVTPVDKLDRAKLEEEARNLTDYTASAQSDEERERLQKELQLVKTKLLVAA